MNYTLSSGSALFELRELNSTSTLVPRRTSDD
ncbi:Uncharacterised protein [Mycobacteroides abscessus subsp. abscessus]|nr:Uncharacterised protein [Mycobacteroides abscessus subsp. abscessus]